tara:strand:- start:4320 stop:6560 length:2241 start_codon:yes stop_codon:yes gene_type:complete
MALTPGKKRVSTTGSSVSQLSGRMGVVRATTADWVATASEALGTSLNEMGKMAAMQEEQKYKSKFTIDAINFFNKAKNDNMKSTEGFYNVVDSYIETTIKNAPFRFKSYAEQYLSSLAASKGQEIHNNVRSINENDNILSWTESSNKNVDDLMQTIRGFTVENFDENMSALEDRFREEEINLTNLRASITNPSRLAALPSIEAHSSSILKKLETEKITLYSNAELSAAHTKDQETLIGKDLDGDGVISEKLADGTTYLSQAISSVNGVLSAYQNDRKKGYGNNYFPKSLDQDRAEIITDVQAANESLIKSFDSQQLKIQLDNKITNTNGLNVINNLSNTPDILKQFENLDQLKGAISMFDITENAGLYEEIINNYTLQDILNNNQNYLVAKPEDGRVTITVNGQEKSLKLTNNIFDDVVTNINNQLKVAGIDDKYTKEQITNGLLNSLYYNFTSDTTGVGRNIDSSFFSSTLSAGAFNQNLGYLTMVASTFGIVPDRLGSVINNWETMNLDTPEDIQYLVNMAQAVNDIKNTSTAKVINIGGIDAKAQLYLQEFYKDYSQRADINNQLVARGEQPRIDLDTYTKNWFQLRDSKDTDSVDKIVNEFAIKTTGINGDNEEYNLIMEELIIENLKSVNDGIWNNITEFLGYERGVVSGTPRMESHIGIPGLRWLLMTPDEDALAFEENFAREIYTDLLPDYIPWYYKSKNMNELDIRQRSKEQITQDLKEMIGFVTNDLQTLGYMVVDE